MKKTLFILTILALGFTACNKDIEKQEEKPTVYQVCIPATMGSDGTTRAVSFDGTTSNSTFLTTEKIYVYNVTADEVLGGYLSPTNLSNNDKRCDLAGSLTGTLNTNDEIELLYNLSDVVFFDYDSQDGTASDVTAGAVATATVSSIDGGVLTTTATAAFRNVQSMFRFKFTDGTSTISVKSLTIHSKNNALVQKYRPIANESEQYTCGDIHVIPTSATTDYIYVALCINESSASGDELTFTVTDADDKVFQGTKAAPAGGFKNGKYYWNSTAIFLAPSVYYDPQGFEILDPAVYDWLKEYHFSQADINALGNNAAATDKLYECWLYNCDFRVAGAGGSVSVISTTFNGANVETVTVQLTRKAPLGAIIGTLYFFADDNSNPIQDESVQFFGSNNDPLFETAPTTGEVIQTATATLQYVTATTITARIIPFIPPDEPGGEF